MVKSKYELCLKYKYCVLVQYIGYSKVVLVPRKVARADPWVVTVITQESGHATLLEQL